MKNLFKNEKGAILMLSFIIMVSLAAVVGAFLYISSVQSKKSGISTASSKAFWIAESGVVYYIDTLLDGDDDWSDNGTLGPINFGEGSFTVETSNASINDITLISTGSISGGGVTITRKIQYTARRPVFSAFSGEYALYGGGSPGGSGDINLNQCNNGEIYGDIYIEGDFTATHSAGLIQEGTVNENQSGASIPEVDWSYWQLQAGAKVFTGDKTFDQTDYSEGGVYYVDGTVNLGSNFDFYGTIIATGSINIGSTEEEALPANKAKFFPASGQPALVSGGDITIGNGNNVDCNGAVYAAGSINIDQGNNIDFFGPLIFGDELNGDNVGNIEIDMHNDSYNYQEHIVVDGFTGGELTGEGSAGLYSLKDFKEIYD